MTFKEFCKELLEEYEYIIFQYDSVISFTQTFPDTTCGLGGIGGQAFTDAQIFIFVNHHIAGINNIARIKKYGDIKEIKRA